MPLDLSPHLEPSRCAILVFECQENVIGKGSRIPGLVAAVQQRGILPRIARLLASGRRAGARVCYCVADARSDGIGRSRTPLHDRQARAAAPGGGDASDTSVVAEIAPEPGDLVLPRTHGMSAFYNTDVDPILRDLEIRTVIPVGVSLNIGIFATTVEAVNRGYRVVVPADCATGDPPEYGDQVLRYSIRNLAYVSDSETITALWSGARG